MGRLPTGRDIDTFLRLSKKGRKSLENLLQISGLSSINAYADKLFIELHRQGNSIVTASKPKKSDDKD